MGFRVGVILILTIIAACSSPQARNGPYFGMTQILPETAGIMGFRGAPRDLPDAETNLRWAVKYLRGAWLVPDGDMDRAVMW